MVKLIWDDLRNINDLKSEIESAFRCIIILGYEIKNMETLLKLFESLPLNET